MTTNAPGRGNAKASAADYSAVFEASPQGALVLEDLLNRFYSSVYVRGGLEAQRETDFRCGRRAVIEFIYQQLERAQAGADAPQPEGD
jgi:hypothetical protein